MNKRVAIFNDTSVTNHYGCSTVMDNLVRLLRAHDLEPVFFWPVGQDWRPHAESIKKLNCFDAIIVNGEGSIHHSATRPRAEFLSALASFSQDELGIPAYLINATLYENGSAAYEHIRRYNKIYVRETMSQRILKEQGIVSKVVPDLSLSFPAPDNAQKSRHGVLITDSVIKSVDAVLKGMRSKKGWSYLSMKADRSATLKKIASKMHKKIRIKEAHEKFNYKKFFTVRADQEKFIRILLGKEFVVTGRFHTVTLCLLTRTPFVALESNTPKISAVLSDVFQSDRRLIPIEMLQKSDGNGLYNAYASYSTQEQEAIESYLALASEMSDRMISEIADDIRAC